MGNKSKPARPDTLTVKTVVEKYLGKNITVEPVTAGKSTYVYRLRIKYDTYYVRFLPEAASFAAEVLAHEKLLQAGVTVPRILAWEEKNKGTGLSLMIVSEIPGKSMEENPPEDPASVLRKAGRELALMHTVPVDGFGWIDRTATDRLAGEKQTFREYYSEFLDSDLDSLDSHPFSPGERDKIRSLIQDGRDILDRESAVLVHGDYDITHIFHRDSRYTGLIDFGEIRGNNRLFDLGTFIGFYQNRIQLVPLLEGYGKVTPLDEKDLFGIEIMALFMLLRLLGRKTGTPGAAYWVGMIKRQLKGMEGNRHE